VYCEYCGLKMFPEHPVCSRCGKAPSHEWIQFTSLMVIFLAVLANAITGWFLLPRVVYAHPSGWLFRGWLWVDREAAFMDGCQWLAGF